MSTTGYLWDARYLGHAPSTVHPERPERIADLEPSRFTVDLPGIRLVKVDQSLGLPWVRRLHTREYVEEVRSSAAGGRRALDPTWETQVAKDSFDVALTAAAGALSLTQQVCMGELRNGFAAIRPPGHHARAFFTRGFCIFNNVALCARYAQECFDLRRVLILDWDVHPADGTSEIFYDDPDVHVVSVHQAGIFSNAVGTVDQIGSGPGEGATHNLPLPKHTGGTAFLDALEPLLDRAAAACKPQLVLISCGFDAHIADPIGSLDLKDDDYARLTRLAMAIADRWAEGRIVSVLEGGYNPRVVTRGVRSHVAALMP